MGSGSGRFPYQFSDDQLGRLARGVVLCLRRSWPIGRGDRVELEDLFQTAYVAGFTARRSAQLHNQHVSEIELRRAMSQAALRLRNRARKGELRDLLVCAG